MKVKVDTGKIKYQDAADRMWECTSSRWLKIAKYCWHIYIMGLTTHIMYM